MSLRALLFRRPPDPQLIEVAFDGEIYPVELRRHAQARRYTLRVQAATRAIVLTMPMRGSVREAKAFAERNGGWIAARLKRLPQAIPFADGLELPLRGVPHRIVHRAGRARHRLDRGRAKQPLICVAGDARISRAACATSSSARRSATSMPRAGAMRRCSASRSSASRSATRRAAGARAPRPACSPIRGG